MVLGNLEIHMQQNEIKSLSLTVHKTQLKVIKELGIKPETLCLIEEKVVRKQREGKEPYKSQGIPQ